MCVPHILDFFAVRVISKESRLVKSVSIRKVLRQMDQGFSVVFFGLMENAEFAPKFHVAMHATHEALSILALHFRPNMGLQMSDSISR
jgi:hypothetical protein